MRKPPPLTPGSLVRYVSPASPIAEEKLAPMTGLLEQAGYRVDVGAHALARDAYLAGPDHARASDLQSAFMDPAVDAIMCTRGGYGCARIMPLLDLDAIAASGKMLLGFSDVTTLHLGLNRRGLPTVHAPMALTLSTDREPWVYASLLAALKGENPIPGDAPSGRVLVAGTSEGIVTGGCLCLLTDSIGTSEALDCEGKILIIEDVDENPHRIDAMLTHLLRSNTIQGAAGIVVGEMTRSDEKVDEGIGGRPWREIVADRLAPLNIPTIIDYPFGHCRNMLSLPLGIRARLDAERGTLTYLESLCAES